MKPKLLSHEERRKLIEAPIRIHTVGASHGWAGCDTTMKYTDRRHLFMNYDLDSYSSLSSEDWQLMFR